MINWLCYIYKYIIIKILYIKSSLRLQLVNSITANYYAVIAVRWLVVITVSNWRMVINHPTPLPYIPTRHPYHTYPPSIRNQIQPNVLISRKTSAVLILYCTKTISIPWMFLAIINQFFCKKFSDSISSSTE